MDEHVLTHVEVDGIGAGAAALGVDGRHALGGGVDEAAQVAHVLAAVEMVSPEGRVDNLHVLHGDVLRVRNIDIARAQGFQIGTVAVELAANPELLPVGLSVAVDGAGAGNSETVHAVGIDQGGKIVERLALHAGFDNGEVLDARRALQLAALLNQKVGLGLEEECARDKGAAGNDDHAAALLRGTVDDCLQLTRLHLGAVAVDAIVGDDIALQPRQVYTRGVAEPLADGGAVGPQLLFHNLLLSAHRNARQSKHHT